MTAKNQAPKVSASANTPQPDYYRVRIEGLLKCVNDLHVGDGSEHRWEDREHRLPEGRENPHEPEALYQGVCFANGKPYIPASTLRGSLRALTQNETLENLLFGQVDENNPANCNAGKLRIFDAFLSTAAKELHQNAWPPPYWDETRKTAIRHGIAVNAVTGTAKHKFLFTHETVPKGRRFKVIIEADDLCRDELCKIVKLLDRWDGKLCSAMGAKKGKGWGHVRWMRERISVLRREKLQEWLRPGDKPLDDFFVEIHRSELSCEENSLTMPPWLIELDFEIQPQAPLLINEPGYIREKRDKDESKETKKEGNTPNGETEQENPPDFEYSRTLDGKPFIPGSSLIGLVRARAQRIVATIAHTCHNRAPSDATDLAEDIVKLLFGSEQRRGALWISDAVWYHALKPDDKKDLQFFNAIDRFTGGVKGSAREGALYQAKRPDGVESYKGQIILNSRLVGPGGDGTDSIVQAAADHPDWWKGLLLFVLRDTLEGELAVGWGKSKGYGAFRLTIKDSNSKNINDWDGDDSLKSHIAQNDFKEKHGDPQQWIDALHGLIETLCQRSSDTIPDQ